MKVKIYIVNVHEVLECDVLTHEAIVFTTEKEAKDYMCSQIEYIKEVYDYWEDEDEDDKSYSRYDSGHYPSDHYDIFIAEQEIDIP